ncbi:hypothetical protein Csa_012885 [Cucumis sativus]|uniref:Uncharacterized protein n=1 Tax=Cucumis sativus TaxID=3659 RepID=A0A0A0L335_CUCSA|nr:hypothetical protein Csa_012885 [Cucumis sativus]
MGMGDFGELGFFLVVLAVDWNICFYQAEASDSCITSMNCGSETLLYGNKEF